MTVAPKNSWRSICSDKDYPKPISSEKDRNSAAELIASGFC